MDIRFLVKHRGKLYLKSGYSGRDSLKNPVIGQLRATNISTFSDRGGRKQSASNIYNQPYNFRSNLIYKNKDSFALFLKIIGEIQLRARNPNVLQPYLDLFLQDFHFERLTTQFGRTLIEDLLAVTNTTKVALEESGLIEGDSASFKDEFCARDVRAMTVSEQKLVLMAKQVWCS